MKKFNKNVAVVVGLEINGLGIVRALARNNVRVIGIDDNLKPATAHTRYCRRVYCKNVGDERLISRLCDIGKRLQNRGVLILTKEESVFVISKYRKEVEKYFNFLLPEEKIINLFSDKIEFAEFSQSKNLDIPRTFIGREISDLEEISKKISYPCIMKPRFAKTKIIKKFGRKSFKLYSANELISAYKKILICENNVIVSEWIEGSDSDVYFCLMYFNKNSEPLASFVGRKIRQWLPECGITSSAEKCDDDYILNESIKLFKSVKYKGFGSLEFKKDKKNGKFKITEPTVGRTDHQHFLSVANGVNIPYIAYCDLIGKEITENYYHKCKRRKWIVWESDIRAAKYYMKKGELTKSEWLKFLFERKTFAVFAWDDPMPWLLNAWRSTSRKISFYIQKIRKSQFLYVTGYIIKLNLKHFNYSNKYHRYLMNNGITFSKLEYEKLLELKRYLGPREVERRLNMGHLCFILKLKNEIVALLWIGAKKISYQNRTIYIYANSFNFSLNEGELWLYNVFCKKEFRSKKFITCLLNESCLYMKNKNKYHSVIGTTGLNNIGMLKSSIRNGFYIAQKSAYIKFLCFKSRHIKEFSKEFSMIFLQNN